MAFSEKLQSTALKSKLSQLDFRKSLTLELKQSRGYALRETGPLFSKFLIDGAMEHPGSVRGEPPLDPLLPGDAEPLISRHFNVFLISFPTPRSQGTGADSKQKMTVTREQAMRTLRRKYHHVQEVTLYLFVAFLIRPAWWWRAMRGEVSFGAQPLS
jgi:hypothetical protein